MRKFIFTAIFLLAGMAMSVLPASAQMDVTSALNTVESTARANISSVFHVISIIVGIIGGVYLAMNYGKFNSGDPSAKNSLLRVLGGAALVIVGLQLLNFFFFSGV